MSGRREWAAWGLVVAVVAVLTWPVESFAPMANSDGSWMAGLAMASHSGIDFGSDLVFTHGPLGFLLNPLAIHPWELRASFAYEGAIHVLGAAALVWALRACLGSLLAAGACALFLLPLALGTVPIPVAFIAAVGLAAGRVPARAVPAVSAGLGVHAGAALLGKLNTGLTVTACLVAALALATVRRRAAAIAGAVAFVVTLAAGWFGTGQGVGDMGGFISGSREMVSGHSEAMGIEEPGIDAWEHWMALPVAALGAAVAWRAGSTVSRRTAVGLVALWLIVAFASFKAGYVRHTVGTEGAFLTTTLLCLAAFAWSARRVTVIAVGLVFLTTFFILQPYGPFHLARPIERPEALASQLGVILDGSSTNEEIADTRRDLATTYPLEPEAYAAIGGREVHVQPHDILAAHAYSLRWRPLRVFQAYATYTRELDEGNARELARAGRPERILRSRPASIDVKHASWESPAANRAMLCGNRAVSTTNHWQVLAASPPRCGSPRPMGETRAPWGGQHAVPSAGPDEMVYGRVDGVAVEGFERLVTTAYKARERWVQIDGGDSFRLVPDTAQNGLIAHVPPDRDFPGPFLLGINARTLAFRLGRGHGDQPDGEITVRWFAVRVAPAG